MRGIKRENARPSVGAIRSQSREFWNLERGRRVKIGFLDTNKVDRMGRKKVKWFSAPGSKTSSTPLKNLERVRGREGAGGVEGKLGARDGDEGAEGEDIKWEDGDKRFGDEGGARVQHLQKGGQIAQWRYTCRSSPRRKSQCYGSGAAPRVRAVQSSEFE